MKCQSLDKLTKHKSNNTSVLTWYYPEDVLESAPIMTPPSNSIAAMVV